MIERWLNRPWPSRIFYVVFPAAVMLFVLRQSALSLTEVLLLAGALVVLSLLGLLSSFNVVVGTWRTWSWPNRLLWVAACIVAFIEINRTHGAQWHDIGIMALVSGTVGALFWLITRWSLRRRPPSESSIEPDDFLNDAHPFMPSSPWGEKERLR